VEDVQNLNHTKRQCNYHVVWIPKYRKKTLHGGIMNYRRVRPVATRVLFVIIIAFTFTISVLATPSKVDAAAYPEKPIHLVVASGPGGGLDNIARIFTPELQKIMGQPWVLDHRPGAGGIIGSQVAHNAKPDGYTFLLITVGHSVNPSLYKKLPYDTLKDFTPVSSLVSSITGFSVHQSMPYKSAKEYIAAAKANPGKLTFGHSGIGTSSYLGYEMLKYMAGIKLIGVAYKGAGASVVGLLTAEVDMLSTSLAATIPHLKGGKIRCLATSGLQRSPSLPDVPAMAEYVPGFHVPNWFGMLAPAGTPKDIVLKVQGKLAKVFSSPNVLKLLDSIALDPVCNTPDEFATQIETEMATWSKILKGAGINPADF
jgi:tripartite-type tricarboxylate transporter receptor subunit TctC